MFNAKNVVWQFLSASPDLYFPRVSLHNNHVRDHVLADSSLEHMSYIMLGNHYSPAGFLSVAIPAVFMT